MARSSRDIQLSELKDMIAQLNTTIRTLNDTIARQQAENDRLKAELAWFRQKMFGSSSERRKDDLAGQLSLFDSPSEEEMPVELIQPEVVEQPKKSRRKKPTLKEQFRDIPVRQVMVDTLSAEDRICPVCGSEMESIGTEVIRSEIVYTPPKLERIEYIATTYACPACKDTEEPQFIKDNGRPALIPGSYVSESLLAYILYRKYGLYIPTRAGENAKQFLEGIEPGFYLMADGYQGYNKVDETRRCCCYAHIRRYFLEAISKGHEKDYTNPAVQGVLYCNKLFEYERTYREKGLSPKQIQNRRLKDQKPVIEGFLVWAKQADPGSNGRLKKALTYFLNRSDFLMTYLEDGRCSLSNNLSENSIRPVTVGRKNWLFSDTPDGASANALYLTIVEMAKAYELNLYKYLTYLLEHRPSKDMSDEELDSLAPWSEDVRKHCSSKNE